MPHYLNGTISNKPLSPSRTHLITKQQSQPVTRLIPKPSRLKTTPNQLQKTRINNPDFNPRMETHEETS